MNKMEVHPIGTIVCVEGEFSIVLSPEYAPALRGLDGYGHVGVFATRSPMRLNPIAVSSVDIAYVDEEAATLGLYYIDAYPGSPVLDLKPYTPSVDRIESPSVPEWCDHWPKSYEESGGFDWEAEFNF